MIAWFRRAPDVVIGADADPYLRRWHVIPRNQWFNIYLHHFLRSDDDRALHDHPWWNLSVLLRGEYLEMMPGRSRVRRPFRPVLRRAEAPHRVVLFPSTETKRPLPVWTLFITGPRVREWGFWCPRGWVHWQDFTKAVDGGRTV